MKDEAVKTRSEKKYKGGKAKHRKIETSFGKKRLMIQPVPQQKK